MSNENYLNANPDWRYFLDKDVRVKIDTVLRKTVILHSQVGTNQLPVGIKELSIKEQRKFVDKEELRMLKEIEGVDPEFVGNLLEKMGEIN